MVKVVRMYLVDGVGEIDYEVLEGKEDGPAKGTSLADRTGYAGDADGKKGNRGSGLRLGKFRRQG